MSSHTLPRHKALVIAILKNADRLRRRAEDMLAPHDVTLQQFNVLRILRGARPEGLCTLSIAERMIEETPGITRLIDRLEKKGLVRRVRSEEDRRQVWCRITPAGERLLVRLDDPVEAFDRAAVRGLSSADQDRLTALLGRLQGEPG
jgi:DNA-binding MarR family transcriptional regulator